MLSIILYIMYYILCSRQMRPDIVYLSMLDILKELFSCKSKGNRWGFNIFLLCNQLSKLKS